ncbi:hypothetical protein QMO56_05785 [Roseomonas sp. E05]|uniref:hypothetical protein n=1 Tax=Roseomonas sp. E05 TaxID=3046310 RepID=UPI0024BB9E81|nr:hypothetical protein [Roseomonas sp. E05]MDJ0387616.1 hypothetical protein [Roseomonas sp. E05]
MSYQREFTDTADLQPWSSQTVFYNDSGQIEGRYLLLDAGGHVEVQYDAADLSATSKVTRDFDTEGTLWRETTNWDDGHRSVVLHDASGSETWSRVAADYTASGDLLNRVVQFDDGHSLTTAYDRGDQFDWTMQRTTQGTPDRLYTVEYSFDDGHRTVLQYDSGGRDWTSQERSYNPAGELISASTQYDDLRSLYAWYDAGDLHTWSRTTQTGSYRNDEISTRAVDFDDGGHLVTRIDPNGWSGQQASWAAQARVTDLHNDLAYSVQFNDDLSLVERLGDAGWQVETTAQGAVQHRSLDLGNGVLLALDYDTAQAQDWMLLLTLSDAGGGDAFYAAAFGDDGVLHQTMLPEQASDWMV